MKYIMCFFLAFASIAFGTLAFSQEQAASEASPYSVDMAVRSARGGTANIEIPGKIFLRNKFSFTKGRKSEGASASLIIKNGKVYVVTAKHLLGEAMGISPEILPSEFNDNLRKWKVMHNDSSRTIAKVRRIYNPNNDLDEDVILLETNANADDAYGYSIDIADKQPELGDKLYVIGCPLSLDSCIQRAYAGTVEAFTNFDQDPDKSNNLFLMDMIHAPLDITGFSGAPVLNENMEIVAIIVGGQSQLMAAALLPKWVTN